jgi:hypothetical protein
LIALRFRKVIRTPNCYRGTRLRCSPTYVREFRPNACAISEQYLPARNRDEGNRHEEIEHVSSTTCGKRDCRGSLGADPIQCTARESTRDRRGGPRQLGKRRGVLSSTKGIGGAECIMYSLKPQIRLQRPCARSFPSSSTHALCMSHNLQNDGLTARAIFDNIGYFRYPPYETPRRQAIC